MKKIIIFILNLLAFIPIISAQEELVIVEKRSYLFDGNYNPEYLYHHKADECKSIAEIPKNTIVSVIENENIGNLSLKVRYYTKKGNLDGWISKSVLYNKYIIRQKSVLRLVTLNGEIMNKMNIIDGKQYEDSILNIAIGRSNDRYVFILVNKTNKAITIDYSNSVFVDTNGESERFMHNGVKYVDRETDKSSSVIPLYSKLTDIIIPNHLVGHPSYDNYQWTISDFKYKFIKCDKDSIHKENSGTEKILLRMIYDNKIMDYTFVFDIVDDSPNLLKIWSDIYEKQKSKILRDLN
jgi:hypothetical protein